ncbi:MAG: hypothetical protein WCG28_01170 [bacterium]
MDKEPFLQHKKSDPMKTSPVPERLDLVKTDKKLKYRYMDVASGAREEVDWNIFQEKLSGDRYLEKEVTFKPNQQNPQVEYFISLLSKGIFHSSDFFKKDGKYFSKGMPL